LLVSAFVHALNKTIIKRTFQNGLLNRPRGAGARGGGGAVCVRSNQCVVKRERHVLGGEALFLWSE